MRVASVSASAMAPRPEPRTMPSRGVAHGQELRAERARAAAPPASRSDARRCARDRWISAPGTMNSRRRWRQPPHGTQMSSPSEITATSVICERPDAISAPIADASAHWPCGYAAFSTFAPTWIEPSSARSAAPTRKLLNTARGRAPSRRGRRPRGRSSRPPGPSRSCAGCAPGAISSASVSRVTRVELVSARSESAVATPSSSMKLPRPVDDVEVDADALPQQQVALLLDHREHAEAGLQRGLQRGRVVDRG